MGKYPGLSDVSESLATELRIRFPNEKFILIAHGLGGLIVKSMILNAISIDDFKLYNRIRRLIFFGTPHLGTDLAKFGSAFNLQISELKLNNELLTNLEKEWVRKITNAVGTKSQKVNIALTNVRGLSDKLVSSWSSVTTNDDYEVIPGSHTTIAKPLMNEDISYLIVRDRILQEF